MRRFGLTVAVVTSLGGCINDPTFVQASDAGDAAASSSSGSSSSSTGGSSASSSSSGGPAGRCSALTCLAVGGKCDGDTCVIACPGSAGCGENVRCPDGADCKVTCSQKDQCKRVTCSGGATRCDVTCKSADSCGEVLLDSPSSTLTCEGKDACKKVECRGASCAVTCPGEACVSDEVKCCASQCTVNGKSGAKDGCK